MGDILGIIEKAELAIDQEDAAKLEGKIKGGNLDFHDLLSQFKTMRKMGNIQNIVKMIPGLGAQLPQEAFDKLQDGSMDRIEAIILSMTPEERTNPDIINGSRRKRLAVGSGTSVEQVNGLVRQLYEMRKQMKQLSKMQKRFSKMKGRR